MGRTKSKKKISEDKILFTEEFCQPGNLYPFTLTRQLQDIRVGILTIREKWEMILGLPSFDKKEDDYKDLGMSLHMDEAAIAGDVCFMIHGNLLPTKKLVKAVRKLQNGEFIATPEGNGIIYRFTKSEIIDRHKIRAGKAITVDDKIIQIRRPWDIFQLNDWAIREDFALLTGNKKSSPLSHTNKIINKEAVFAAKDAKIEHAIIDASTGPVFIGKNAEIMPGCMIRGPLAMCEGSVLKMGSKVYGATTLGPYSIAAGEIKNSVLFGYSNKAHDGYLGDSVVGEWCNMGAGTTNSNLKNTASDVRIWTPSGEMVAGIKCGVIMGDYSRTAINTSINTGTMIGVGANVFGSGLTPKYIPNFSWGSEGIKRYEFDKALMDIAAWKKLKHKDLSVEEKTILKHVFDKH